MHFQQAKYWNSTYLCAAVESSQPETRNRCPNASNVFVCVLLCWNGKRNLKTACSGVAFFMSFNFVVVDEISHKKCPLDEPTDYLHKVNQWEILKKYRNWYFMLAERMTNEHALQDLLRITIAFFSSAFFLVFFSSTLWPIYTFDFACKLNTDCIPRWFFFCCCSVCVCIFVAWQKKRIGTKSTFVWTRHWKTQAEKKTVRLMRFSFLKV